MVWGDHIRAVNVSRGVIKKSRKAGFFIDVFFYALWRFIASDISSNDAFDGNNGSKYTLAVPGCMRPCLGQYRPASVPTGKIGNFNLYANNNKPRFNGIFWPGFARVPSPLGYFIICLVILIILFTFYYTSHHKQGLQK